MSIVFFIYNVFLLFIISIFSREVSIIIIGLIGLVILQICARKIDDNAYKKLFLTITVGFSFMFLLYFALIQKNGIPYHGGDDELFEKYGSSLYSSGVIFFKDIPYIQGMWYAKGYLLVIAWIKRISELLGNYSTLSPRILNIYLWQSISILMYKSLPKSMYRHVKLKAFIILATIPNALFIASFVYRDIVVCFLIVVVIQSFEKIMDNKYLSKTGTAFKVNIVAYILLLIVSMYFLYYIRMQMCFVVCIMLLLKFFLGNFEYMNIYLSKKKFFLFCLLISIFLALYYSGGLELLYITSKTYTSYRLDVIEGLSSRIFFVPILPFGIIFRFIYGLVSPFPGGLLQLNYFSEPLYSVLYGLVLIGTIFQIFLVPYLLKNLIKLNYTGLSFLVIFLSIIMTTFTFRHFIMIYPFMMKPILIEYNDANNVEKKIIFLITNVIIAIITVLYILIK